MTPSELTDVQKSLSALAPPTVAWDLLKGTYLDKVYIVTIPTNDWTMVPAYLRWGGWNACPPPEYHVVAFRSWRDRYGAKLVGMSNDTIDIKVASKPASRKEALALVDEQYEYCPDIVDQGTGSKERSPTSYCRRIGGASGGTRQQASSPSPTQRLLFFLYRSPGDRFPEQHHRGPDRDRDGGDR